MNEETESASKDINDHEHASRPGWVSLLVLIAALIAVVVWIFGGFG